MEDFIAYGFCAKPADALSAEVGSVDFILVTCHFEQRSECHDRPERAYTADPANKDRLHLVAFLCVL